MTARSWNQNIYHVPAIPDDVARELLDLEVEIGAEAYERWVDAFIPKDTTWDQVKMLAAKTLDEIQGSRQYQRMPSADEVLGRWR